VTKDATAQSISIWPSLQDGNAQAEVITPYSVPVESFLLYIIDDLLSLNFATVL